MAKMQTSHLEISQKHSKVDIKQPAVSSNWKLYAGALLVSVLSFLSIALSRCFDDPTGWEYCQTFPIQVAILSPSFVANNYNNPQIYIDGIIAMFKISYPLSLGDSSRSADSTQKASFLHEWMQLYAKGPKDVLFLLNAMFLLTLAQYLFNKVTQKYIIPNPKFSEQLFLSVYYIISISTGIYIWANSEYYPLNTWELWTRYPVFQIPWLVKYYYLITGAFWLQQLTLFLVFTPAKDRRKDHWQMTAHHFITSCLVIGSYIIHATKVGNFVLIIMDTADVFLTLAKCLKYLGPKYQVPCDISFGLFAVSWFITRHVIYLKVIWSHIVDAPLLMSLAPYDPYFLRVMKTDDDWERHGAYYSTGSWAFFQACFLVLQGLLIFWFTLIIKVIRKVITGAGADDVREDDD